MLEHAIQATTFPGDIVLDCFAGGGNTSFDLRRHGVENRNNGVLMQNAGRLGDHDLGPPQL